MSPAVMLVAAVAVPVPPARQPILDYHMDCRLFGPEKPLGRIVADTTAKSSAMATITVTGDAGEVALPNRDASAMSEQGEVAVRSKRRDVDFSWIFHVSKPPLFENGTVTVTARSGTGPICYVATGICAITTSKAIYQ